MAMAGLGKAEEIAALPFHTFMALRYEYLAIIMPPKDDKPRGREIAPGVTLEEIERPE